MIPFLDFANHKKDCPNYFTLRSCSAEVRAGPAPGV
jgi:hypothetical protein